VKLSFHNYGECEVCDAQLIERPIRQDFRIGDQLIVVENVPAGVCPQCGEKVVNATVGRHLAELMRNKKKIAQATRISIPALAYQ
jgi:YgiT-type zinc finger domain-containing protein